jgi:hypothetical protein
LLAIVGERRGGISFDEVEKMNVQQPEEWTLTNLFKNHL